MKSVHKTPWNEQATKKENFLIRIKQRREKNWKEGKTFF